MPDVQIWFDLTKDILPNHMISTDVKDMPEFFQKPEYDGTAHDAKSEISLKSNVSYGVTLQEVDGRV